MQAIGVDLGGTKLHAALFSPSGEIITERSVLLEGRTGSLVAELMAGVCLLLLEEQGVPAGQSR